MTAPPTPAGMPELPEPYAWADSESFRCTRKRRPAWFRAEPLYHGEQMAAMYEAGRAAARDAALEEAASDGRQHLRRIFDRLGRRHRNAPSSRSGPLRRICSGGSQDMSDTFDPSAFLSELSDDGAWYDEFLAWCQLGKWQSDEEACAAFIAEMFDRLQADRDSWYKQASDRLDDALKFAAQAGAARAESTALRAFALEILSEWPDVGFELHLLGHKHGLLKPEQRFAPCSEEGCRCADDADELEWKAGVTCYRKTPLLTGDAK